MQSFGVNVDDDVADQIKALRQRESADGTTEIVSRSQVIRELLALGLVAENVLDSSEAAVDSQRDKEALVRQAIIERVRDERE
jgi:hypothetical protein